MRLSRRAPKSVFDRESVVDALIRGLIPANHIRDFFAFRLRLLIKPVLHPREMTSLFLDHPLKRPGDNGMNAGAPEMKHEVPINAPLENLRKRENLEQRDWRADFFDIPILIRVPNRTRLATNRDD